MEYRREGNELVITFDARMDSAQCVKDAHDIETAIASAKKELGQKLKVKFNVGLVTYGSSSFLRICLSAAKSVGTASFGIVGANESLKKIFGIAGFDKILTIS